MGCAGLQLSSRMTPHTVHRQWGMQKPELPDVGENRPGMCRVLGSPNPAVCTLCVYHATLTRHAALMHV